MPFSSLPSPGARDYLFAVAGVAVTTAAAFAAHRVVPHAHLSLVFLTGVLGVAALRGLGPSLFAGLLSFLAFNFLFTPPYYTLQVADDGDVVTLLIFLLVAAITGQLAGRLRDELAKNRASLRRTTTLYGFSRQMAAAADRGQVLEELATALAGLFGTPVAIFMPDAEGRLAAVAGGGVEPPPAELERAWRGEPPMEPAAAPHLLTLATARRPVGLAVIAGPAPEQEQRELAQALCDQAASAMERTALVADLEEARMTSETEQLRSALLSSVSHDLRTPLASIIGSTSTLLEYGGSIGEGDRRELLATVMGEAERLDRYIQNLLDMTRLGHGGLELLRDWSDVGDIVNAALDRLRSEAAGVTLEVELAPGLPLLFVHGVFIEQALVNILDNAIRFTPAGGTIRLRARVADDELLLEVCDQGPGIPEAERERIFDMFYSISGGDRQRQGTGLGLAICRGLVGAHGGAVTAHPGLDGRGSCIRIHLPLPQPLPEAP